MQHHNGDTIDRAIRRMEYARTVFDTALSQGYMTTKQRYQYQESIVRTVAELASIASENNYESSGMAVAGE